MKSVFLTLMLLLLFSLACFAQSGADGLNEIKTKSPAKKPAPAVKPKTPISKTNSQPRKKSSLKNRSAAEIGDEGLMFPPEMTNQRFSLQLRAFAKLINDGYQKPIDFSDLAALRNSETLVELPIESNGYIVEQSFFDQMTEEFKTGKFTTFDFDEGTKQLSVDSTKYKILEQLAKDFDGTEYNLNLPADRQEMRLRLLRMLRPEAIAVLEKLAQEYNAAFKQPLVVTAMVHSVDYYLQLNAVNPNSYRVRDVGSLPPHASGCVFDISRAEMPVQAQNFLADKLAKLERAGKIEALVEFGSAPVFHVFVFPNGKPPEGE